jgi:hypothetical protein
MRFIRISLKRLLLLVALVSVLLYVLVLRPVAIAKQFTHKIEVNTDLESVSDQYFDGMRLDGTSVGGDLEKRTWTDIFKCRQRFSIRMKGPLPNTNGKRFVIAIHDFYSTPLGVQAIPGHYLVVGTR